VIVRLVREQLRSQWRYTAWSAALLAFALGLATYAMVTGATAIAHQNKYDDFSPYGRANYGTVQAVTKGDLGDAGQINGRPAISLDELVALIRDASAEGPLVAGYEVGTSIAGYGEYASFLMPATPVAWGPYLESGVAPEHGEVAVGADVAEALGLGLGDRIVLDSVGEDSSAASRTFVVSGTLKTTEYVAPYWTAIPNVVASPSDFANVAAAFAHVTHVDAATSETTLGVHLEMGWDGDNGVLAPYADQYWEDSSPRGVTLSRAWSNNDQAGYRALGAAGLIVLGMIIAAFSMGRAQAEARTTWAATARVFGATRRTIALSSLIETSMVSLVGIAIGLVIGIAAVAASIGVLRATHPDALLPAGPNVPGVLILAGFGIGAVIAAVVAAVPAFWAARVSPVAALKSVTPVGEATVSRRVSRWWLIGLLVGLTLVNLVVYTVAERVQNAGAWAYIALALAIIACLVVGFAALVDGLRELLPRVAERVGRLPRPWAVAAGDSLRAHHRLFTYASVSMALTVGVALAAATVTAFGAIDWTNGWRGWGEPPMVGLAQYRDDTLFTSTSLWAGIGGLGLATLIAVVVTLSSRAALSADGATRSALGLSRDHEVIAAALRQWTPMVMGILVGGALGWVLPLVVRLAAALASPNALVYSGRWNLTVAGYGLTAAGTVVGLALAVSLIGSLVVGLLTRPGTPVEALRRTVG
jgi:hypothetical protein